MGGQGDRPLSSAPLKAIGPKNVQDVFEASRNEVESYLIRNCQRFVFRPELRNPVTEDVIPQIITEAHLEYLFVLTAIDDRVQDFYVVTRGISKLLIRSPSWISRWMGSIAVESATIRGR
jgi:hypothetical protein